MNGPIHRAVTSGSLELCELLAGAGAKLGGTGTPGTSMLSVALWQNRADITLWAASKGVKFDLPKDALAGQVVAKAAAGQLELIQYLQKQGASLSAGSRGVSPMFAAATEGHLDVVEYLLGQNVEPDHADAEGVTPLIAACARGRAKVVARLLKAGANVNQISKRDMTPLRAACFSGSDESVALLLAAKADVKAASTPQSNVLSLALSAGASKSVAALLAAGAEVEPRGQYFELDLQYALAIDSAEFLGAALAAGMSADRKLPGDWSALQVAHTMSAHRCIELLVGAGATGGSTLGERLKPIAQLEASPRLQKLKAVTDPRGAGEADFKGETVVVEAVIDETGAARFARATCQDCRLSRAAAECVMASVFTPAKQGGTTVATRIQIPIRFLDRSEMFFDFDKLDKKPKVVFQVNPQYPMEMKVRGVEGRAVVEFIVANDGTVRDIKIVSASEEVFGPAAAAAIEKWRFEPGLKDGVPVATRMQIPMGFKLGH